MKIKCIGIEGGKVDKEKYPSSTFVMLLGAQDPLLKVDVGLRTFLCGISDTMLVL